MARLSDQVLLRTTGQHNIRPMARTLDTPFYEAYIHGNDFITMHGLRELKYPSDLSKSILDLICTKIDIYPYCDPQVTCSAH